MSNVLELRIEKIVYPGKSLARRSGKVVFTDSGLPGEPVEIEILRRKKAFDEAKTVKIIEPSKRRITPRCEHYETCSSYQYIDYKFQLEIKKEQFENMFQRSLKIDPPEITIKPSPVIWGYRNKIRLAVIWNNKIPSFSYRRPSRHNEFVSVETCHLVSEKMNAVLDALLKLIVTGKSTYGGYIKEVTLRQNSVGEILLILHLDSFKMITILKRNLSSLEKEFPVISAICLNAAGKKIRETILWGAGSITERVGTARYHIGALSFFQINVPLLSELIDDIRSSVKLKKTDTIADLYCGIGTFGLGLRKDARTILGVESNPSNVEYLKKNIDHNHADNFIIHSGTSEKQIDKILSRGVDMMIVDPPRRGLKSTVCNAIAKNPPPKLVYISCDPATLIRDLDLLLPAYKIKELAIYDFFPHTPHIETMVFLKHG